MLFMLIERPEGQGSWATIGIFSTREKAESYIGENLRWEGNVVRRAQDVTIVTQLSRYVADLLVFPVAVDPPKQ